MGAASLHDSFSIDERIRKNGQIIMFPAGAGFHVKVLSSLFWGIAKTGTLPYGQLIHWEVVSLVPPPTTRGSSVLFGGEERGYKSLHHYGKSKVHSYLQTRTHRETNLAEALITTPR